jgi:hypothetical protein
MLQLRLFDVLFNRKIRLNKLVSVEVIEEILKHHLASLHPSHILKSYAQSVC